MLNIRIHGDNIVECERTWMFIKTALYNDKNVKCKIYDSAVSPKYEVRVKGAEHICVQFFPGFGRWTPDILEYIKNQGAKLRETPDTILSIISRDNSNNPIENPILAIEYCGALPAGNQAWQRCGRAYSLSASGIPYLYIAEIGGVELDKDREEKAARYPNPVVPFSYITHSLYTSTPTLPIFLPSPNISKEIYDKVIKCFGADELTTLLKNTIYHKNTKSVIDSIISKALTFVNILSEMRKKKDTYTESDWQTWLKLIAERKNVNNFISQKNLQWEKTAYIENLTLTAKNVMQVASEYAVGVGACQVPICLIPKSKRRQFAERIISYYSDLQSEFKRWLSENDRDLCITWIMGFKPRGDDARPDRGLPPLARMLLSPNTDFLSFIYGPAKVNMWKLFINNPVELSKQNGLWESIMACSDAVLIDSSTDKAITKKGYLHSHWYHKHAPTNMKQISLVKSWPTAIGENDVDTVIHLLFGSNGKYIFEGMCNPPGGDWSGISIIGFFTKQIELRWLSLPRVSKSGSKRPDHVFQFLQENTNPIILAVESKENESKIDSDIGKNLIRYVKELFSLRASAQRDYPNGTWIKSDKKIILSNFQFASAVAILVYKDDDLIKVKKKSHVDIIIGVKFNEDSLSANILIHDCTPLGSKIVSLINSNINLNDLPITITQLVI